MEDVKELETLENQLTTFWAPRDAVMKADRKLISLIEPKKVPGFVGPVTINKPKTLWDISTSMLCSFEPLIRVPWKTANKAERAKYDKVERFLVGVMRDFNKYNFDSGHFPWLYELSYWINSGWVAGFPYITEDKPPRFTCELIDPISVYPMWGKGKMSKLLRKMWMPLHSAMFMSEVNEWDYKMKADDDLNRAVKVLTLWEDADGKVFHTAYIDGQMVKPQTIEKSFVTIPIFCVPVAGTPEGATSESDTSYIERKGESIIAANRATYELLGKWLGFLMQIAQDAAYPPIQDFSESGKSVTDPKDLGSGKIIPRKKDYPLEVIKHAGAPGFEISNIFGFLNRMEQDGGLPAIATGNLPFEISGYMGSQLFAAIKYKLNSRMLALTSITGYVLQEMIRQFKASNIKKLRLTTEYPKRLGKGESFMEEFSSTDIPEHCFVEITLPLITMSDKAQQILMARQAISPPQVISRQTLWEEYLGIQDIDLEQTRLIDDMIDQLPEIQLIAAIEGLKQRSADAAKVGKKEQAQAFMQFAEALTQKLMAAGINMKGVMPGGGQPPGVPSNMMPAEAGMAGMSPDIMAQMAGQPPAGGTPGARTMGAQVRQGMPPPGMS